MAKFLVGFLAACISTTLLAEGEFLTLNSREWRELDLTALAKNLDRTRSKSGSAEFLELMQPVADKKLLMARQEVLRSLLVDKKFSRLDRFSAEFATQVEDTLLHLLDSKQQISVLSQSELGWFLQRPSMKVQLFANAMTVAMFAQYAVFSWQNLRNGLALAQGRGAAGRRWIWWNVLGDRLGLLASGYFTALNQASIYNQITTADAHVLKAGQLFELAYDVDISLRGPNMLSRSIFGERMHKLWLNIDRVPRFKQVVDAARTRYRNRNSIWRYWDMLSSVDNYEALRDVPTLLIELQWAFGELDAYMSVARLYREYQSAGEAITFAKYLDSVEPQFQFEHLENPLVESSVENNFALDGKHWVITGPHACGKTTAMRSIAYAFVMGQSIGIVPAKKAEFAPLTSIKTYLNVGDSIVDGKSSFVAEHERMSDLKDAAREIRTGERVLMLVDEPYAKTIQMVGEPMVVEFLRDVNATKGLSVILATHFEKPAQLDADRVVNYQPQIDDDLKPTFKIIPGAASWWFKDADRRDRFIRQYIVKGQ